MAVTRLTTNGLTGTKYDIASADNYYMEPIATTLLSSATGTITFSNIPSGYKHLQIRGIVRPVTNNAEIRLTINGDSGSNYARHRLIGNGASVDGTGVASQTSIGIFDANGLQTGTASVFGALVIDILDYGNTSKYKTIRVLSGNDNNGSGQVGLSSGLWMNTGTVTSVTMVMNTGNIDVNSRFSLYGIKA
jgi:hypothetical protein